MSLLSERNILVGMGLTIVFLLLLTFAVEYFNCMLAAQEQHTCVDAVGKEMLCIDMTQDGAWLFKSCRYCKVCEYDYEVFHLNRTRATKK